MEGYRKRIEEETTINTLRMKEMQENDDMQDVPRYRDGQLVKIVGVIENVNKKYTKMNREQVI